MYEKPLPTVDTQSAPFWEGAQAEKLMLQHCHACQKWIFYPRAFCVHCGKQDALHWEQASGQGVIYTFTICRRAGGAFQNDVPYVLGLIDLKEGPRMLSQILAPNLEQIRIGQQVSVVFDQVTAEITLPKFSVLQ